MTFLQREHRRRWDAAIAAGRETVASEAEHTTRLLSETLKGNEAVITDQLGDLVHGWFVQRRADGAHASGRFYTHILFEASSHIDDFSPEEREAADALAKGVYPPKRKKTDDR
jgi:hypothetical protein